jgi:23S rRNA (uracil1939-C5)-methyltransferase
LREKQHRVSYALQRIGFDPELVQAIWPAPETYAYRRRAQFKTDGTSLGYAGSQGRAIAKIERCLILNQSLQETFQLIKDHLPNQAWQPGLGHVWNYIDVDESSKVETLVLNRRQPFAQANAAQNEAMRQWLMKHLSTLSRDGMVLELFCGSGNFTEILVQLGFTKIIAFEVGASAIEELKAKAWRGVDALRADLYANNAEHELRGMASEALTMVLNPPRAGMKRLSRLPSYLHRLEDIYYISCDPQSFVHDARRIIRYGFQLREVQPLDQMPHTPHVEILAHFQRSKPF